MQVNQNSFDNKNENFMQMSIDSEGIDSWDSLDDNWKAFDKNLEFCDFDL